MGLGSHAGSTLGRGGLLYALPVLVAVGALVLGFFRQKPCDCVVLIGDSITSKWTTVAPSEQLSGLVVVNRGVPGDSTSHMLARFRRDVVRLHPRAVVILGGINDIAETPLPVIERHLASMADSADRHGIRVVLATLPPTGEYEAGRDSTFANGHDEIRLLNTWITNLAAQRRYALADYHAVLADDRGFYLQGLTMDGVHPTARGYARMEPVLQQALTSAIASGN